MDRRKFLTITAASGLLMSGTHPGHAETITESLSGDPSVPAETLQFDSTAIRAFTSVSKAIGIKKDPVLLAQELISVANSYVGYSSDKNTADIEQWLHLFRIPTHKPNGKLQPFCAAGISWSACQAYCNIRPRPIPYAPPHSAPDVFFDTLPDINKFYFRPHCSVNQIMLASHTRNTWVKAADVKAYKPGWLVIYDWDGDGFPDHIGLLREKSGDTLSTTEFNTTSGIAGDQSNGGLVAKRTRSMKQVLGMVAWY